MALTSRVIKTEEVNWQEFQFIQQDNFRELSTEAMHKLKASILSDSFIQPYYVWEDTDGVTYCLDGKHRNLALKELIAEGVDVPYLLPATFIKCENKREAAKLVTKYSSIYAKITQQGLFDFLTMYDLDFSDLKTETDLPEFSEDRFEQKFNLFQTDTAEEPEVEVKVEDIIVKEGDLFQLNDHRIICGSFKDDVTVSLLMGDDKARIVNCDPPYNIPFSLFVQSDNDHKEFSEGVGEMTDEQFVQFLALIMQRSVDNSVPGAIHYIFMDWRHVWHMTEAARRVYGSPQPKQMCVWNKDIMANGSFYRPKHELCFVFNNPQAKALWNRDMLDEGGFYKDNEELVFIFKNGDAPHLSHLLMKDRIRSNVWNYTSTISTANPDRFELKNHPTPKPVAMIADSILDTTNEKDIVIDWFLGSGTCLIACEQTNRRGRFTEIEPRYVQGDIIRYINFCQKRGIEVKFTHLNGDLKLKDFNHDIRTNNIS